LEGQWSIPGGILEVSETILQGVERELEEETGLVVRAGELIEVFERIIPDQHGRTQYHFVIIDHLCERLSGSPRPGGDALEAVWVEQGDLERYSLVPAVIRVLGKAFELARLRDSAPQQS
jgi:8-oxo-dGTP diphosphatase